MVKDKHPKKEPVKGKKINHPVNKPEVENILIDNFVSFQKVMTNLSVKFDNLANQISKLLDLFEISAKALAEKDYEIEKSNKENAKILGKIENVLEQNKTIARGLTLMHDKINEPRNNPPQMQERSIINQQKMQFKPVQQKISAMEGASEEYHRPISSNEQ